MAPVVLKFFLGVSMNDREIGGEPAISMPTKLTPHQRTGNTSARTIALPPHQPHYHENQKVN